MGVILILMGLYKVFFFFFFFFFKFCLLVIFVWVKPSRDVVLMAFSLLLRLLLKMLPSVTSIKRTAIATGSILGTLIPHRP